MYYHNHFLKMCVTWLHFYLKMWTDTKQIYVQWDCVSIAMVQNIALGTKGLVEIQLASPVSLQIFVSF